MSLFSRKAADRFERSRTAVAVAEAVQTVVDHYRIAGDLRQARLFAEWSKFVGDKIGERTRPETIVDRTLIVEVATSTWLHELRLIRPKVVSDLLDMLGLPRFFDDIRFVLAKERRHRDVVTTPRPRAMRRPPQRPPVRAAGPEAAAKIVAETTRVEDPELRELIARVRIANDR